MPSQYSLYSDFSLQRRTNPDGYASNITAWQTALSRAALAGHLRAANAGDALVLKTSDKLASELESAEFGRPVALQCVIDEAARSNAFVPLGYFLSATSSPFARSWLPALSLALPRPPSLGQVLGWGVRTLKGAIIGHSDEYGSLNEGEHHHRLPKNHDQRPNDPHRRPRRPHRHPHHADKVRARKQEPRLRGVRAEKEKTRGETAGGADEDAGGAGGGVRADPEREGSGGGGGGYEGEREGVEGVE
ncbi:hypothetical protein KEM55_005433 [Ascosphaera atra]|nr:hypothetical protein KEM55_005433 [Ascosphaera atra]